MKAPRGSKWIDVVHILITCFIASKLGVNPAEITSYLF